jgi:hypothetical protein
MGRRPVAAHCRPDRLGVPNSLHIKWTTEDTEDTEILKLLTVRANLILFVPGCGAVGIVEAFSSSSCVPSFRVFRVFRGQRSSPLRPAMRRSSLRLVSFVYHGSHGSHGRHGSHGSHGVACCHDFRGQNPGVSPRLRLRNQLMFCIWAVLSVINSDSCPNLADSKSR